MQYRILGKTGYRISEISFGSWAIGGTWGPVDDEISLKALDEAIVIQRMYMVMDEASDYLVN